MLIHIIRNNVVSVRVYRRIGIVQWIIWEYIWWENRKYMSVFVWLLHRHHHRRREDWRRRMYRGCKMCLVLLQRNDWWMLVKDVLEVIVELVFAEMRSCHHHHRACDVKAHLEWGGQKALCTYITSPFHTQCDRRHETITNRNSVKNLYIEYIGSVLTVIL